jgi:hypothetical protein
MRVNTSMQWFMAFLLAAARLAVAQAPAEPSTATAPAASAQAAPAVPAAPAPATAATRTLVLRANSLIPLRFAETVSSDVSKPGTTIRMEVTDDINVDDAVLIPAGSVAIGEVIDAQAARAFGKAGKLVVSARRIQVGQREIKLHSNLGSAGRSQVAAALFVPFIHGKQAVIPADTEVVAKTAGDESFDVPAATAH